MLCAGCSFISFAVSVPGDFQGFNDVIEPKLDTAQPFLVGLAGSAENLSDGLIEKKQPRFRAIAQCIQAALTARAGWLL